MRLGAFCRFEEKWRRRVLAQYLEFFRRVEDHASAVYYTYVVLQSDELLCRMVTSDRDCTTAKAKNAR